MKLPTMTDVPGDPSTPDPAECSGPTVCSGSFVAPWTPGHRSLADRSGTRGGICAGSAETTEPMA